MTATGTTPPKRTMRPRLTAWSVQSDDSLARKAAAGDREAFAALFERYRAPLEGYCRSILLDAEDASDALQSTMLNALAALGERDATRPVKPWLYRIAHNESITLIRRRRPHDELGDTNEPLAPGVEIEAEQRARLTQLVGDLRTLPDRQRGALVMREFSGLEYEEIADALHTTPVAARRAVFDARTALHEARDGRNADCSSIRLSLSDGDRRSLRARRVRAHLRSCDDCATFGRAIRARRADLHALAPLLSGAVALGVFGIGAGGAGGGAAIATGGLSWAGLPTAAKGVAVAVGLATTGTAAVQVEHAATPDKPKPRAAQVAAAPPTERERPVTTPSTPTDPQAAAPRRAAADRAGVGSGDSVRSARHGTSSSRVAEQRSADTVTDPVDKLLPPVDIRPKVKEIVEAPKKIVETVKVVARPVVKTTEQIVTAALTVARDRMQQALELARRTAGAGTEMALSTAANTLQGTLDGVRTTLEKVLAGVGIKLPSTATASPSVQGTNQGVLDQIVKPVQGLLGNVGSLLQKLLGRR